MIAPTHEFAEDNAGMDDESIEARPVTGQVTQHDTYSGGSRPTRPLSAYEVEGTSFAGAAGVGAITMPSGMSPAVEAMPAEEPVLELG